MEGVESAINFHPDILHNVIRTVGRTKLVRVAQSMDGVAIQIFTVNVHSVLTTEVRGLTLFTMLSQLGHVQLDWLSRVRNILCVFLQGTKL